MDKIEDCVASLESANVDQIYVPGLVVLIESKLDVERTKELTTSLAKDKPNPEDRPKYVLDFLANEKKAAKLMRNYLPKPKKKTRRSRASRRRNSMMKERNYSKSKCSSENNKSQERTERNFAKEGNFKSERNIKRERNFEEKTFETERNIPADKKPAKEVPKKFKTSKIPKLRCRDFFVQKFPQFIQKFQPKDASVPC